MNEQVVSEEQLQAARDYADALIARNQKTWQGKHWNAEGYANCPYCFGPGLRQYGIEESTAFWCSAS